jgi:hypothetical protein
MTTCSTLCKLIYNKKISYKNDKYHKELLYIKTKINIKVTITRSFYKEDFEIYK